MSIFTIGHGTRTLDEVLDLLKRNGVQTLVDIRSFPRSRTNPQFNREHLQQLLAKGRTGGGGESEEEDEDVGVRYLWMGELLGGRRPSRPESSQHSALRVAAFRNYAAWMETAEFKRGLRELKRMADGGQRICLMCSETLWWRCHRRMVSDALLTEGREVRHLGVGREPAKHVMWDVARVGADGHQLIYDGGAKKENQQQQKRTTRKQKEGGKEATEEATEEEVEPKNEKKRKSSSRLASADATKRRSTRTKRAFRS